MNLWVVPIFPLIHKAAVNFLVHVSWWPCVRISYEWNYWVLSYAQFYSAQSILLGTANLLPLSCVRLPDDPHSGQPFLSDILTFANLVGDK